jgi:photosystem II stability/assembly factor-like uncharacterized protein
MMTARSQWCEQMSGNGANFRSIFFADTTSGWAASYFPRIMKHTSDMGNSWQDYPYPDSSYLESIFFTSQLNGWAAGDKDTSGEIRAALYHTADGGLTWEYVNTPLPPGTISSSFNDIFFLDSARGWAAGYFLDNRNVQKRYDPSAIIVRTTDAGATWQLAEFNGNFIATGIHFITPSEGRVVGELDNIYRTWDGGVTWEKEVTPSISYWYRLGDVFFTDQAHGWAVGYGEGINQGIILKYTEDKGWEAVMTGTGYKSVFFTDSLNGWVSSWGILRTTDGGKTWNWELHDPESYYLYSVHFPAPGHGWAAGNGGHIFRTCNSSGYAENELPGLSVCPNPARGIVDFRLPALTKEGSIFDSRSGRVMLKIFDVQGRERLTLLDEVRSPGEYTVQFEASVLEPGIYFYRLTINNAIINGKLIISF